jgi:PAT family beta-lactamase induction signal transducer AmpG
MTSWRSTLNIYADIRMLWVFCLGVCSGFPWALIGSNLSGWLKDEGISRGEIGLLGSVTAIFALNFLWAPLVDSIRLPWSDRFGRRRSWVMLCQAIMLVFVLALAMIDPPGNLGIIGLVIFAIATLAATQDIAIDAFRIDQFEEHEKIKLPAAAAMSVIGWWTGYSWPGALGFSLADSLGWNYVYWLMAGLLLVFILITAFLGEREFRQVNTQARLDLRASTLQGWLSKTFYAPLADFFSRNSVKVALTLLLFIFLFKIGESFLGRMSVVFYKEVGFSNEQIAQYSKMFGWLLTVVFTLLGSVLNTRYGVLKGLVVGGIAMAGSNLMFALLAYAGPVEWLFLATLLVDNFCAAFSSVAFVAFLSSVTGRAFSATQYALLASIGNFGRTSLSGVAGYSVSWLGGWPQFFVLTTVMVLPSLILLWLVREQLAQLIERNKN